MDKQSLESLLAEGLSVERIGKRFEKHPSTVSYWMTKYGLAAANRDKHAAKGGIERWRLAQLVEAGMTIAEIAKEVGLGTTTVRRWRARYGLRTRNKVGPRHAPGTLEAKAAGLREVVMSCARHGETEFVIEGRGYYRCKRCRADRVTRRRQRVKATLVREAGGRCLLCGYDRFVGALEFHHIDPTQKRLTVSTNGSTLALDVVRAEAAKCALLCSNCHAEVEGGVTTLPVQLRGPL